MTDDAMEASAHPAPARVLVIEDDPINMEIVSKRLVAHGFQFALARTGGEGIALALREAVDVVLLDLRLPDMDGFRVMETLHGVRPGLPIVIMTAHGSADIAEQATRAGADGYLLKPMNRQVLVATLERAIAKGAGA